MAKRKRLTLPDAAPDPAAPPSPGAESRAALRPGLDGARLSVPPPIAQVAADGAAAAALKEVSDVLAATRAEGRMVQRLPLAAVEATHLARDRLGVEEAELDALMASIRAHGQRMPIEVTEIGDGRYGLISGWRRLAALARLEAETGEARFGAVLALVRQPATAAEAYVAMVEENELRLALSHFERARIVAACVDLGVFATEKAALNTLFAAGSRARRSKIGSFVALVRALDGALRHPGAVPERLGLRLAAALETGAVMAEGLRAALAALPPEAGPGAEAAALAAALKGGDVSRAKQPAAGQELRPGLVLTAAGGALTLSGPAVTPAFRARLEAWLQNA
jgi:hypothetical protein